MVVTDLDGTLLNSNHQLSTVNEKTLLALGEKGVIRAVATGRILYSVQNVLDEDFPIDYLIFSSGAGILDFQKMELIYSCSMVRKNIKQATDLLHSMNLNFMIHGPVLKGHECCYFSSGSNSNQDFAHRLSIYEDFAIPWDEAMEFLNDWEEEGSIIISSVPADDGEKVYKRVREGLGDDLHVVRTTSPLNEKFNWIEILPPNVSKASASLWLKTHLSFKGECVAIGNDFNDIDLLNWADTSYVVSNAPEILKTTYDVVKSNDEDGFCDAVRTVFKV